MVAVPDGYASATRAAPRWCRLANRLLPVRLRWCASLNHRHRSQVITITGRARGDASVRWEMRHCQVLSGTPSACMSCVGTPDLGFRSLGTASLPQPKALLGCRVAASGPPNGGNHTTWTRKTVYLRPDAKNASALSMRHSPSIYSLQSLVFSLLSCGQSPRWELPT